MEDKKNEILKKFEVYSDESVHTTIGDIAEALQEMADSCLAEGSASGWVKNKDVKELINDLTNLGQLLYGIMPDAKAEGWWSEWDEEQVNNIGKWLKKLYALPPGQLDKEDGRAIKI